MRELAGQRARGTARKGSVEIATIGQIAAVGNEPDRVHDWHQHQRARQSALGQHVRQTADDFYANDLVTMDGGADKRDRPLAGAMDDLHR